MPEYEYDVALSFAGEERPYVQQVAQILQANSVVIFYDDFEEVTLWGKDLAEFLDGVYRTKARYSIVFVSEAYARKAWTTHERKSALARAIHEKREYILPARFDDTELPGIQPTIGYIDLRNTSPEQFAALVIKKLGGGASREVVSREPSFRVPRISGTNFNPYSAALSLMSQVKNEIQSRCNSLSHMGISASSFGQDREHSLRVVARGETIYSLDMKLDEFYGRASMTFNGVAGVPTGGGGSHNASGHMEEDAETRSAVLRLNDLSLLEMFGGESLLSPKQFVDALWERICDEIERANKR